MTTDIVRVLFVDDDELVLRTIERAMRTAPVQAFFTTDPEQAFGLVVAERIDIVVSDQSMPELSGVELFGILRRLHEHVLRVMLTGQNDRETAFAAINEGRIHRFLEKPWQAEHLRAVIGELARDVRAARAAAREATALPTRRASRTITRDLTGTVILPPSS